MHYSSEINSSLNINQLSLPLSFTDLFQLNMTVTTKFGE